MASPIFARDKKKHDMHHNIHTNSITPSFSLTIKIFEIKKAFLRVTVHNSSTPGDRSANRIADNSVSEKMP